MIPVNPQPLIDRLATLSSRERAHTALMIDPPLAATRDTLGTVIEQLIQSDKWSGFFSCGVRAARETWTAYGGAKYFEAPCLASRPSRIESEYAAWLIPRHAWA